MIEYKHVALRYTDTDILKMSISALKMVNLWSS